MDLRISWALFASVAACSALGYDIRMPEQKDGTQMLAATELIEHLDRAAQEVPYSFVFAKPEGEPDPKPFESCYLVRGGKVWLWGDDSGPETPWLWGDNRPGVSQKHNGTLFAVELFAREQLGLRFVWAGKDGIAAKSVKTLKLKEGARGSYTSALTMARIRSYASYYQPPWKELADIKMPEALFGTPPPTTHQERLLWHKRNMLQDRAFFAYGHAFTDWKARFLKTHPDFLNLHIDPKTGKEERGWTWVDVPKFVKLCVSNEAVVDQVVADWVAAGKSEYLNVCENDANSCWCECANCRALDAPKPGEGDLEVLSDRYVNFWNRIAKKARAIRPDVKLVTYLYSNYRIPSRRERLEYGDAMVCGFVCDETEDAMALINGWKAVGMKHFFRPNYLHTITCIHRGLEKFFFDQFHEMLDAGMIGVDYDANDNRPTTSLEFYVLARAFSDPKAKFDDIMRDYCSAYGKAADEVRAYYAAVQRDGMAARDAQIKKGAALAGMDYDTRKKTLPHFTDGGRNEAELREKLEFLKKSVEKHAAAKDLSNVEMARLKNLALQAEHGLLTFRFLSEVETLPIAELEKRANALNDFRVAHVKDLPDIYGAIYRLWWSEIRYWKRYWLRYPELKKAK